MSRFVVFDVETPNRYNNRMSAIGISVVVHHGFLFLLCQPGAAV